MATILKKDVTLESIEEQVKRLQSYIDSRKEDLKEGREINLEELNQLIPIHYGNIKVVSIENEYHVCVPNYEQKQLEEWITDCSYFLEIVQKTFKAGKRTKTLGKLVPFRFDSPVIIANHTFEVEDFYAHRFDDETWYIAPVDQEIESQPLSGAKAYEISPDYPNFYDMMHLPTDTIVIFHKGEIVSVLNEDSQDIWNL